MSERDARDALQEQLSALSVQFLDRTRRQVTQLELLVEGVGRGEAPALLELRAISHKIHGSGAMFGFPDISEPAGLIERASEELLARDPKLEHSAGAGTEFLQQVTAAIGRLAREVETACNGTK
jgi:HPt (histidine-containing phosphotransfer) domain-containing protein